MTQISELRRSVGNHMPVILKPFAHVVFIEEQSVPVELEWDEDDKNCVHMLVYTKTGKPVATGRMLSSGPNWSYGCFAEYRHQGIGKLILRTLLIEAEKNRFEKSLFKRPDQCRGFLYIFRL